MIVLSLDTSVLSFGEWGEWWLFIRLGLLIHSSSSRGCLNVSWIRLLVNSFVIQTLVAYGRFVYAHNSPVRLSSSVRYRTTLLNIASYSPTLTMAAG